MRDQLKQVTKNHLFVSNIYDQLLKGSLDVAEAYSKACVAIYELDAELNELRSKISAGYVRADTSHIKWQSKHIPQPVDNGDEWITTGAEHG
jgi:hypothetical protein